MSKEALTQDEIDALLKKDAPPVEVGVALPLSPTEEAALTDTLTLALEAGARALGTLLGQNAELRPPSLSGERPQRATEGVGTAILARIEYTQGITGLIFAQISEWDALAIADLLIGGDGRGARQLGEVELSALGEAISQMAGASATELSGHLGQRILFSSPEVLSGSDAPGAIETDFGTEEALIKVSSQLVIGDLVDSELLWLMAPAVGKQLARATPPAAIPEPPPLPGPRMDSAGPRIDSTVPRGGFAPPAGPPPFSDPRLAGPPTTGLPPVPAAAGYPPPQVPPVAVQPVNFGALDRAVPSSEVQNIGLIMDVPLELTVELGRTRRQIKDILALGPGSLIELDKLAGEAVDVLVNGKLVAKGEVVVIDENFGVRITDILSPAERVKGI